MGEPREEREGENEEEEKGEDDATEKEQNDEVGEMRMRRRMGEEKEEEEEGGGLTRALYTARRVHQSERLRRAPMKVQPRRSHDSHCLGAGFGTRSS
eukprot:7352173-Pyramimonas_sp.AAC.1